MTNDTQIKDSSGTIIDPATLTEQQALKKGTWALGQDQKTITASATTTLLTQAGPVWIIGCGFWTWFTSINVRDNSTPYLMLDAAYINPHYIINITQLKVYWGLDNSKGIAKITLYDDTTWNYAMQYDYAARPLWVPSGKTFYLKINNIHATDNYTAQGYLVKVS